MWHWGPGRTSAINDCLVVDVYCKSWICCMCIWRKERLEAEAKAGTERFEEASRKSSNNFVHLLFVNIMSYAYKWTVICYTHIHTQLFYNPLGFFSGLGWASTRKVNQSRFTGARDSEWQWHQLGHMQICTIPAFHHWVFYRLYYAKQWIICCLICKRVWPTFTTPHSAPPILLIILASSSMNTFPSPIRSQLSLNPAIITFVNFVASVLTSTSKQPLPLPPPSSTPNLTTVTLFTTIYQSLK